MRGKKGLSMAMVQRLRARFRVPADLPVRLRETPTDAREASGAALVDGVDAYSQNRFSARLRHCCSPETW